MDDKYFSDLKQKSIASVKWSFLAEILAKISQPVVLLILARLLSPEDFGVVAVATIIVGFTQTIQEMGFGKAIVQTSENIEIYCNNTFWINIILSIILFVLIFLFAPAISSLLNSPKSVLVIKVLSLQLIINSFFNVQTVLFKKDLKFNILFYIRIVSIIFSGLLSILLAYFGYGVWALVFGTLFSSMIQLAITWGSSKWRPIFDFDIGLFKKMFSFSQWVFIESILVWFLVWGDSVVLAHFLGVTDLGIYRLGSSLIIFLSNFFFTPIIPIAFSYFSRLQNNQLELKKSFIKLSQLISTIAVPLGFGTAILSGILVPVILGSKWHGTEIVIAFMAIRMSLGWIVGLNSTIYTAIGRPDLNVKLLLIVNIIAIPAYIISAPFGIWWFCMVRVLTAIFDNLINNYISIKLLKISIIDQLLILRFPLLSSIVMVLVLHLFVTNTNISLLVLIFSSFLGASTYFMLLYLFDNGLSSSVLNMASKIIKGN